MTNLLWKIWKNIHLSVEEEYSSSHEKCWITCITSHHFLVLFFLQSAKHDTNSVNDTSLQSKALQTILQIHQQHNGKKRQSLTWTKPLPWRDGSRGKPNTLVVKPFVFTCSISIAPYHLLIILCTAWTVWRLCFIICIAFYWDVSLFLCCNIKYRKKTLCINC